MILKLKQARGGGRLGRAAAIAVCGAMLVLGAGCSTSAPPEKSPEEIEKNRQEFIEQMRSEQGGGR